MALYLSDYFPEKKFTDFEFENHLKSIQSGFDKEQWIEINFRFFQWFDLWATIQLLFLIEKYKDKKITIYFASPNIIRNDDERKNNVLKALQFLLEMEFVDRADDLGCPIRLQTAVGTNETVKKTPIQLKQMFLGYRDNSQNNDSHIIPITRISELDLNSQRERLYHESKVVFDKYFSESIVQEAGLGDCLLSELVSNVLVHTPSKDGYIALRAVGGLRKDAEDYEQGKYIRTHHPLHDWRTYFSDQYNNGFFELVVVDQGEGIPKTISKNDKIQITESETHDLLKYALEPFSSSLTKEKRKEKNLTEFTGLGAVSRVLTAHNGCLMIRQEKSRHIFYDDKQNHKFFTNFGLTKATQRPLTSLIGTTVTAIIPLSGHHTRRHRPYLHPENLSDNTIFQQPNLKFFKVVEVDDKRRSFSENYFKDYSWKRIVKEIDKLPDNSSILLDLKNVSINKNRLWTGLSKVKLACDAKKIGLFLAGIDERTAFRLEDYSSFGIDGRNDDLPWVILGFSDDDIFFAFGTLGIENKKRQTTYEELRLLFDNFERITLSEETKNLLTSSHYIDWETVDDDDGDLEPVLKTSFSKLRFLLKQSYAQIIETHIRDEKAWLPEPVQLISGDIVLQYLCIHSITQITGIYPDLSRLIRIISDEFNFDFVLSVGTAARTTIVKDLTDYKTQRALLTEKDKKITFYSYQDYFSFDHGEDTKSIIKKDSKVLIIVDGVRKTEHCAEAIDHVKDCEAEVVAIIALIDLNGNLGTFVQNIPFRYVLSMPVEPYSDETRKDESKKILPEWIEDPYSHKLIKPSKISEDNWKIFYDKASAYHHIETYGIIQSGHTVFLNHHFWRSFALSYFFHSRTTLSIDLVEHVTQLIVENDIDTIIYPEHSSIGKLVEEIKSHLTYSNIKSIICRRAVYPGKSSSYTVNLVGKDMFSKSEKVLIIDDQVFSGNSLKSLVNVCLKLGANLQNINIFVVIESMLKSERRLFETFLKKLHSKSGLSITVKLNTFMRFPVYKYWETNSCPICKLRKHFEKNSELKHQFIESNYAKKRLEELDPQMLDHELHLRKPLTRLESPVTLQRINQEPVIVTSMEGYELFCESAYVEGDIKWLVDQLEPEHAKTIPNEIIISIVDLLSREIPLLFRVRLRQKLIEYLMRLLFDKTINGEGLTKFLEVLAQFPLFCLKDELWKQIWASVLSEHPNTFYQCYPGAHFLLQEIMGRANHPLKERLLSEFKTYVENYIELVKGETTLRNKVQLVRCLLRSSQFEEEISLSWLIFEISKLLMYPLKEEPTAHQVLYKGLLNLSNITSEENSSKYVYAVQMLGHLLYCFEEMTFRFPEQAALISHHNEYKNILELIDELQTYYPYNKLFEDPKDIQVISRILLHHLFTEIGEFQPVLEKWLNRYMLSLEEILAPLTSIKEKEIILEYNNPPDFQLLVVIDADVVERGFGQVAANLINASKNYLLEKSATNFSDSPLTFKVKIDFVITHTFVEIIIQNPCTEEDSENIKKGDGKGIKQIFDAFSKFNYKYQYKSDNNGEFYVSQSFQLRKL